MLQLSAPYVTEHEGFTQLNVDTVWTVNEKTYAHTFFYAVEKEWAKYLVTEKSDAFVLAFLEVAMEHQCDLRFEKPVSEELKYQLEHYLMPVYAQHFSMLHEISLLGPVTAQELLTEHAVGTGFSCGVDSFYAVLSHLNTGTPGKNVTHLVLAVNGAAITGVSEELDKSWFEEETRRFRPLATELGLPLIGVRSNVTILNHYKTFSVGGDCIVTSAFAHILGKLFDTYYWASAYPADVLEFETWDGGFMEPFALPLISERGLRFYHAGSETKRIGKVAYIADNSVVQKGLTVCCFPTSCGRCVKCLRTMSELYAVGKLDAYEQVFPVADYKAHFASRLAEEFAIDHPPFTTDIQAEMKKNGIHIPLSVYVRKWAFYVPTAFLRKKLRNNRLMMRLWYEKGWREKITKKPPLDPKFVQARMSGKGKP